MQPSETNPMRDDTTSIRDLRAIVDRFCEERQWGRFHTPRNLATSISIEAAELLEHFQWETEPSNARPVAVDSEIAQELADVTAYVLRLASVLQIDLAAAVQNKMILNAQKYPLGDEYEPKKSFGNSQFSG